MDIAKKQRKIEVNYKPLKTSACMEVVGSVSDRQFYDAVTGEFAPDYTLTPLTLFPRCTATDPDKYTKSGVINSALTNMKWYENIGGTRTLITADDTGYEITESGEKKGQIKVNKNSSVLTPITLEFSADYLDSRTGQVFQYKMTAVIIVSDATDAQPVLTIDSASTIDWNPVRDVLQQTITAKLMAGDTDVTAKAGSTFFWYRKLDNGNLEQIVDGTGDNDWEVVSVNKNVLVIDRDFIGDQQTYVCRAHYDTGGAQASSPVVADPMSTTTIRRRIPKVECDWKGVTSGVPGGTTYINPVGYIRDSVGVISNPEEWFKFVWYTKSAGAAGYAQAAVGVSPKIPFSDGMMIELRVEDKGPQALVVDDDDTSLYITMDDGTPLYQRINEQTY